MLFFKTNTTFHMNRVGNSDTQKTQFDLGGSVVVPAKMDAKHFLQLNPFLHPRFNYTITFRKSLLFSRISPHLTNYIVINIILFLLVLSFFDFQPALPIHHYFHQLYLPCFYNCPEPHPAVLYHSYFL